MPDQTEPGPGTAEVTTRRRESRRRSGPSMRSRATNIAANLISLITTIIAAVLAVHIVFVMFEANTSNGIVRTVGDWAETLAWQFRDVFAPKDPQVSVLVNYGLAAIVYLIVGRTLARLVNR